MSEKGAEVEMSNAGLVAEAGDEDQRVAHVEVYENIQDEESHKGRELDRYLNPGFPVDTRLRSTD